MGITIEKFRDDDTQNIRNFDTIVFPMFDNEKFLTKVKYRASGSGYKHMQRIYPSGSSAVGLFGWNTITDFFGELVITEGEYDAMAVH